MVVRCGKTMWKGFSRTQQPLVDVSLGHTELFSSQRQQLSVSVVLCHDFFNRSFHFCNLLPYVCPNYPNWPLGSCCTNLLALQISRTLLRFDADPNVTDGLQIPPLFIAVGTDHPELIHSLLERCGEFHGDFGSRLSGNIWKWSRNMFISERIQMANHLVNLACNHVIFLPCRSIFRCFRTTKQIVIVNGLDWAWCMRQRLIVHHSPGSACNGS